MDSQDNITQLAYVTDDNRQITPEATLAEALKDIRADKVTANKAMVLLLNHSEDDYDWCYYASNMTRTEKVALLAVIQQKLMSDLNGS